MTPIPTTTTPTLDRVTATYTFIRAYIRENVYPPTMREIADHLGTSTSMAFFYCDKLEGRKLIERVPGIARGLRVL